MRTQQASQKAPRNQARFATRPRTGNDAARLLADIEAKLRALRPLLKKAGDAHTLAEERVFAWQRANPRPGTASPPDHIAWWNDHCSAIHRRHGLKQKERTFASLAEKQLRLVDEATGIRATTIDALKCKARIAKDNDGFGCADDLAQCLVSDILALRG